MRRPSFYKQSGFSKKFGLSEQSGPHAYRSAVLVIGALIGYWRKHWGQFGTLIIGLASATALFVGVQALNSEAKASYDRAENSLTSPTWGYLKAKNGSSISVEKFADLRQKGLPVSPVIRGSLSLNVDLLSSSKPGPAARADQATIDIIGVDLFTLGAFFKRLGPSSDRSSAQKISNDKFDQIKFIGPAGQLIMASLTAKTLLNAPLRVLLPASIVIDPNQPPGQIMMDIRHADRLLQRDGFVDRLLLTRDMTVQEMNALEGLIFVSPAEQIDVGDLSGSFHLNLTAFSLLSFLVGLFIVFSAVSLAFQDRLPLFRSLLALGVRRSLLQRSLIAECMLLSLLAGLIGTACGAYLANILMPGISLTLKGLYGARVEQGINLRIDWILGGLVVSIVGGGGASFLFIAKLKTLPITNLRQGRFWLKGEDRAFLKQAILACGFFIFVAIIDYISNSLLSAFAFMAGFLVASALVLPLILQQITVFLAGLKGSVITRWFWADTRQETPRLGLALMALLIALSAHMGVKIMVEGYRTTFTAFLEERLAADLYIQIPDLSNSEHILSGLESMTIVRSVAAFWTARSTLKGKAIDIVSIDNSPIYLDHWTFLQGDDGALEKAIAGKGILINEQLAYRQKLSIGDKLSLEDGDLSYDIVGVYADYGNMLPQIRMARSLLMSSFDNITGQNLGVMVTGDPREALLDIAKNFDLSQDQIINQRQLKSLALGVFNQTFEISAALGLLTLIIAGVAFLSNLLMLSSARLMRVAPAWGMGVRRSTLGFMEGLRSVLLGILTAIVAFPVGIGVAWILVARINLAAFGWRLPFSVSPAIFLEVIALATVTALLASLVPSFRLARISPTVLAKRLAGDA